MLVGSERMDSLICPKSCLNNACLGLLYKAILCLDGSCDSLQVHRSSASLLCSLLKLAHSVNQEQG